METGTGQDGKEITLNAWHSMADAADRNSNGGWTNVAIESTARPHELSWNIKYQKIDEDFLPYLGLHGEIDIRKISSSIAIYDKPNNGQISGWKISLGSDIAEHLDGSRFYNATNISSSLSLKDGRSLSFSAESSDRPPNRDNVMRSRYSWGGNNLYSNGGVSIASGKLVGGDYLYGKVSQGWKISDRLSASSSYEYGQIMEPSPNAFISRQYTETFTYDLDDERTFGGRFIIRNSESNLYLAFKQRVRFGTDIYVIFGDPNSVNTSKSCMVKLVRTL